MLATLGTHSQAIVFLVVTGIFIIPGDAPGAPADRPIGARGVAEEGCHPKALKSVHEAPGLRFSACIPMDFV